MPIYFRGVQTLLFPIDEFHFVFYNTIIVPCSYVDLSVHLTSIIAINFKLYLSSYVAAAENQPALYRLLTLHVPNEHAL